MMSKFNLQYLTSQLLLLTFFTTIHFVKAQEINKITLSDAIQTALQKNINLGLFVNQVATSKVSYDEENAKFYPEISAAVTTSKSILKSEPSNSMGTPQTGEMSPTSLSSSMDGSIVGFQISSKIPMLNILETIAYQNSAELLLSSKEENLKWQQQTIIFKVISDYLQVLQSKELVTIEKENIKMQIEQLAQIETFYKAGKRSEADFLLQQADIKQSELDGIKAERDYETYKIQLKETMGERDSLNNEYQNVDVKRTIELINRENVIQNFVDNNSWIENRDDLKSQKFRVESFAENARSARASVFPSVSFNLDLGSNYYSSLPKSGFMEQVLKNNMYGQIGLSLSLPVFDRFRIKHKLEKAEIQLSDEYLNLENIKLSIKSEIEQVKLDFETAQKQRESAQAQYNYTSKALEITKERYSIGAATFIELSEARVKNIRASYQKITADYNYILQYAAVHYANGGLNKAIEIFQ